MKSYVLIKFHKHKNGCGVIFDIDSKSGIFVGNNYMLSMWAASTTNIEIDNLYVGNELDTQGDPITSNMERLDVSNKLGVTSSCGYRFPISITHNSKIFAISNGEKINLIDFTVHNLRFNINILAILKNCDNIGFRDSYITYDGNDFLNEINVYFQYVFELCCKIKYQLISGNKFDVSVLRNQRVNLTDFDYKAIVDVLNVEFFNPKKLQFTSHGVQKVFRFWSETEIMRYLESVYKLLSYIESHGETIFIGAGTLLGFVRDNALLEHDDDIDAYMLAKGNTDVPPIIEIEQTLRKYGLEVIGDYPHHRHVRMPGSFYIDIFSFERRSEAFHIDGVPAVDVEKNVILPLLKHDYKGFGFPIPNNPNLLLEKWYGKNWLVPDPYWSP